MSETSYAVILAGGRGERFWPLSTASKPKQLLELVGGEPLLGQAVNRLEGLIPSSNIFIITNLDLVDACREAAPMVPDDQVVGEPVGRDTAPAVALGAALVQTRDPDAAFCVLTADHVIDGLDSFQNTLRQGLDLAAEHHMLITIGIQPTGPSTGFGYIEAGNPVAERAGISFAHARRFVEKPDFETATSYLAEGNFCWNSGMFIWTVKSLKEAFTQHCPELAEFTDTLTDAATKGDLHDAMVKVYPKVTRISIDYALMEKADNIAMARGNFSWDDVGSWSALANHFPADADGNISIGEVEFLDSSNNIVVSKPRTTALIGVHDLIVVQADNVTLICPRAQAQQIKELVRQLEKKPERTELL